MIKKWCNCSKLQPQNRNIILGNGDDCAVIDIPEGCLFAQSIDTYIAERHFPKSASAKLIAVRTLSASLRDLAAMGAEPQLLLGQWLSQNNVSTAIDISDKLLADFGQLASSQAGACIDMSKIPLPSALLNIYNLQEAYSFALTAGDDYQLCFCWPKEKPFPDHCPVKVTEIGAITDQPGVTDTTGKIYTSQGFNYFS